MKVCSKCNVEKSVDNFYSRSNECKSCKWVRIKTYREFKFSTDPEWVLRYKETNNRAYHNSRAKITPTKIENKKIYNTEYYKKNKEKILGYQKKYYNHNTEQVKISTKKYRTNNPEKIKKARRAYEADKLENDISFYIKQVLKKRVNYALKTDAGSIKKAGNFAELTGLDRKSLVIYLETLFKPGMTWENYGVHGWHIDHIKPCASFDLTDPEQQKQCFHYTNLQPLWAKDNLSKGAKIMCNPYTFQSIHSKSWADIPEGLVCNSTNYQPLK